MVKRIGTEVETGIESETEAVIGTGNAVVTDTVSVTAAERGTGTRKEVAVGTGTDTGTETGTETEFVIENMTENMTEIVDDAKEVMKTVLEKIEVERGINQEVRSKTVRRGPGEVRRGSRKTVTDNETGSGDGMGVLLSRLQSRI